MNKRRSMTKPKKEAKANVQQGTRVTMTHVDEFTLARASSIVVAVFLGILTAAYSVMLLAMVLTRIGVGADGLYAFVLILSVCAALVIFSVGAGGFIAFAAGWLIAMLYNTFLEHVGGVELVIRSHTAAPAPKKAAKKSKRPSSKSS